MKYMLAEAFCFGLAMHANSPAAALFALFCLCAIGATELTVPL